MELTKDEYPDQWTRDHPGTLLEIGTVTVNPRPNPITQEVGLIFTGFQVHFFSVPWREWHRSGGFTGQHALFRKGDQMWLVCPPYDALATLLKPMEGPGWREDDGA